MEQFLLWSLESGRVRDLDMIERCALLSFLLYTRIFLDERKERETDPGAGQVLNSPSRTGKQAPWLHRENGGFAVCGC